MAASGTTARAPRLGSEKAARDSRLLAERCSANLALHLRRIVWPVVEPRTVYKHGWHIDALAAHLEAVSHGDITRLIVNVPPRTMKSTMVAVAWPTWEWLRAELEEPAAGVMGPHTRWMFASYAASLSTRDSLKCRRVITDGRYQRALAHLTDRPWKLTGDQNVKQRFENTAAGFRLATSVGAMATGEGGDRLVADDPHNAQEAESDLVRSGVVEWWQGSMSSRLNDPNTGAMVIVMQRLHESDVVGAELEQAPDDWTHLCLPMDYEAAHPYAWRAPHHTLEPRLEQILLRTGVDLTGGDPRDTEGELLAPARIGREAVDQLARRLGSYRAAGQLQQRPAPAEGGIFKRAWWRYYVTEEWARAHGKPDDAVIRPELSAMDEQILSWDMAFKDEEAAKGTPDYVVGQSWARLGTFKYLIDQRRAHLDFPDTCRAVEELHAAYPDAYLKLIEDKANGPAVIATLRGRVPGLLAVEPDGGKIARANAVSPQVEAGDVFVPHPLMAAWAGGFIDEMASFPNAANDDQVDACTQALNRLRWGGATSSGPDVWA